MKCVHKHFLPENFRFHLRRLFDGALYTFVAAAINFGVNQFIYAISESIDSNSYAQVLIGLNVGWSLFSQIVGGLLFMFYTSDNKRVYEYITEVATNNSIFAWQMTAQLIILHWIEKSGDNKGLSILAWIIVTLIALLLILIFTLGRLYLFNINRKHLEELAEYESETFALASAFSFTLILVVYIYSDSASNFLGAGDDINPVDDDVDSTKNRFHVLFVIWCLVLTAVAIFGDSIDIPRLIFNETKKIKDKIVGSYKPPSNSGSLSGQAEGNATQSAAVETNSSSDTPAPNQSCCYLFYCCTCSSFLNSAFGWEESGLLKIAYLGFFEYFFVYLVCSAWYSWSILSLQIYFVDSILGLLIFAIAISAVFTSLLLNADRIRSMNRSISDERVNSLVQESLNSEKSESILLITGQFICGWSWNSFISSAIALCFQGSHEKSDMNKWNRASVSLIFALIITMGIGYIKVKKDVISIQNVKTGGDGYNNYIDDKHSPVSIDTSIKSPISDDALIKDSIYRPDYSNDADGEWQVYGGGGTTKSYNSSKIGNSKLHEPLL
jgi:hypothetical protein